MTLHVAGQAHVDPRAQIGEDVEIGPFCVVGPHVTIGRGTRLQNNVTLAGHVTLGEDNHIFPGAVIGAEPQDVSYRGADTQVIIGNRNTIRECVTINRATEKENGYTIIGDDNYLMANCHVAHDCRLGSHIIIANGTLLGGHVHIHDHASLSGGAAVHHYATVGGYAFISGLSRVLQDVPPYMLVDGTPSRPRCINVVALKRNNFDAETIHALAEAHRLIFRAKVGLERASEMLRGSAVAPPQVEELLNFVQTQQEGRHGRSRERRRAA